MFFDRADFKIDIQSVLFLSWENSQGIAANRPYHALSFRRRGDAEFCTADETFHVSDGAVLYVPKGCGYTLSAKHEELFVVHFNILNSENVPLQRIERLTPGNFGYYDSRFSELLILWTKKQSGYLYECDAVFYKLLASLHGETFDRNCDNADKRIAECVDYIHEHFTDRELSVEVLSRRAGMSDTYFRKLFVSSFGTTPLRYINNLRISHAAELLRSGYYSVEQVAEKAGFGNSKYLSAVLRKNTGFTPFAFKHGDVPLDFDI